MNIVVYGAGSIGSFYGALLHRAGLPVWFIARGDQLNALRDTGLRVESALGDFACRPLQATSDPEACGIADLILIAVKQFDLESIIDRLGALCGADTTILTLQNGLSAGECLAARFGPERTLIGVPFVSVQRIAAGHIRHATGGHLSIGAASGQASRRAAQVAKLFAGSGVSVRAESTIYRVAWLKLAWNAAFSALTCLTGASVQDIVACPRSRQLALAAMREVAAVARARGVAFDDADVDMLLAIDRTAPPLTTSMRVDRERGRALEHDMISGLVVEAGTQSGVSTPVNSALYALLTVIDTQLRKATATNIGN